MTSSQAHNGSQIPTPTAAVPTQTQIQNAPHLLLCEALGFSPQLLLDDIINIANNAVQDGVNGMEEFLQKWADERVSNPSTGSGSGSGSGKTKDKDKNQETDQEATTHEVEQGLVAFQTLLEYHTDIAFDFFEAWCLRNIFMIQPELASSVVLLHQEGLDLSVTPEEEQAAVEEVEELRRRLDGHRKLNRLLTRALRTSTRQLTQSQTRLSHLSALSSLSLPHPHPHPSNPLPETPTPLQTLASLPPRYLQMYTSLSSPSMPATSSLPIPPSALPTDPGKREWETGKSGYVNWALGQLLVKGQGVGGGGGESPELGRGLGPGQQGKDKDKEGHTQVDKLDRAAASVGSGEELRAALEVVGGIRKGLEGAERRPAAEEQGPEEEDESMDVE